MPELWLPAGPDPLTTHRVETWRVDLLTSRDAVVGRLDGVTGGDVKQSVAATISGGGTLTVVDRGQDVDWLSARLRVWWQVDGADPWALGTFIPSAPVEDWDGTGRSWRVELLDKLLVLDEDKVETSFSLPAGTVVTAAVRSVIAATGETAVAITDSAETLTSGMVWEPGTSRLRIVNDLLAAINYFSLRADGLGRFVAAPYTRPQDRPVVREFHPGDEAIHREPFTRDQDLANIPNRVVLVSAATGEDPALVGVATNTDPTSPTSVPRRGRTIVHAETGVEATSQAVIDSLAARRLTDLSQVAATQQIEHAAVPLDLNAAVSRRWPDGTARAVVTGWTLNLQAGALMRTSLREVAP